MCATYTLLPNTGGSTGGSAQTLTDNGSGGSGCDQGYPLAAGAQLTFSPEPGDTALPNGSANNQMTVRYDVLNPSASNKIAAVVDVYRSDGNRLLGSYNALVQDASDPDDVGTNVIAPIAMKSTSGFYTVIGVVNLGESAANVSIQYVGNLADGTGSAYTQTVNLGSVSEGTFNSTYSVEDMPLGFIGFARVVSDQPVAVTVIRGKQTAAFSGVNEAGYAAVNGVPEDRGATEWAAPLYFRRYAPGAAPSVGYNSWVQVQVVDGSTANVTLRYVGDPTSGCPVGPYELNTTVTNSKVFYANLNGSPDNGFASGNAPSCFFGGLEVTANKPIVMISQVGADKFPGGDSEGVANSFPDLTTANNEEGPVNDRAFFMSPGWPSPVLRWGGTLLACTFFRWWALAPSSSSSPHFRPKYAAGATRKRSSTPASTMTTACRRASSANSRSPSRM